jgi:hypothetical protein
MIEFCFGLIIGALLAFVCGLLYEYHLQEVARKKARVKEELKQEILKELRGKNGSN